MGRFEETIERIQERIILNEKLKGMEGDIIGVSVEDVNIILQELENTKADLYEANNRITDLLDIVEQKDKIIQEMIKVIIDSGICDYFIKQHCVHYAGENKKLCDKCILEYFEERCKNAKD